MTETPALQGAHVELRDISKSFGGTRALAGVSLTLAKGSIHALVGENGAGKSTLGKIIAGVHAPDQGRYILNGEPVRFHSPRDAIAHKVIMIAQELSIVSSLTVAENVFLGVEPRRQASRTAGGSAASTPPSPGKPASTTSPATSTPAACGRRTSRRWRSSAPCPATLS